MSSPRISQVASAHSNNICSQRKLWNPWKGVPCDFNVLPKGCIIETEALLAPYKLQPITEYSIYHTEFPFFKMKSTNFTGPLAIKTKILLLLNANFTLYNSNFSKPIHFVTVYIVWVLHLCPLSPKDWKGYCHSLRYPSGWAVLLPDSNSSWKWHLDLKLGKRK